MKFSSLLESSCRPPIAGFTLVELLVTVAIVAVLVVCAVPALQVAHDFSLRAQCTSRIRDLSSALLLYAHDHEQTLPSNAVPDYHNSEGIWFGYGALIVPYLGMTPETATSSPQVFSCPMVHNDVLHPSYLFNGGNQYDGNFPGLAGRRLVEIRHPTRTLLLYELSAVFPVSWHAPSPKGGDAYLDAKSIASFADGHVSFMHFYWDGKHLSPSKDPPEGYDYQWSAD